MCFFPSLHPCFPFCSLVILCLRLKGTLSMFCLPLFYIAFRDPNIFILSTELEEFLNIAAFLYNNLYENSDVCVNACASVAYTYIILYNCIEHWQIHLPSKGKLFWFLSYMKNWTEWFGAFIVVKIDATIYFGNFRLFTTYFHSFESFIYYYSACCWMSSSLSSSSSFSHSFHIFVCAM